MAEFSRLDRIAFAVLLSIGGVLSIIGSALIVYIEFSHEKEAFQRPTYNRFLRAMCVYKIAQGIWAAIGTMAAPPSSGGYGSIGNTWTCSAQGFFSTLSLSELIYNAGLSIYYVAVIRYGLRNDLVSQRLEPIVHLLAFIKPLMFGISGLVLTVYNSPSVPELGCWASPKPIDCVFTHTPCDRGAYSLQWAWAFSLQQCIYVGIVIFMSALLHCTVRTRYRTHNRYASRETLEMRVRSREVSSQALLFAAACLYCNMWAVIFTINFTFRVSTIWTKIAAYNGVWAFNSQGLFNFLVYVRPRYVRQRRRKP